MAPSLLHHSAACLQGTPRAASAGLDVVTQATWGPGVLGPAPDRKPAGAVIASKSSGRRGRLIGSLGYILVDLGRGTGPRGEKMAGACPGTDSQDLATILDPFRAIYADLGPDCLSET